jgi:hypothetical protein
MADAWHIGRSSRTCAHSGESIDATQPFFSALAEKDDGFSRLDFTIDSWPDVEKSDFLAFWKNKGGAHDAEKKPGLDYDRLLAFFDSLEQHDEPRHRLFRYVLALVLSRRRILRLDDLSRTDEGERIVVYDRRIRKTMEIISPEATREELERVQERLNQLFDGDAGDMAIE